MFGAFRLLLAYLVVLSHLSGSGYIAHFGLYAVRGFFVLSGFVITAALNDVYAFDARRFWANRLLRLLPLHLVVCLLTLAAVLAAPYDARNFTAFWSHPNLSDVVGNLLVLGLQFEYINFRLVVPAWSIAVELTLYGLLFCFVARRATYALAALVVGVFYHVDCLIDGAGFVEHVDWTARYFPSASAVLSFSFGALLYFGRQTRWFRPAPVWTVPTFAAWLVNIVAGDWWLSDNYTYVAGYYLNTLLTGLLILSLSDWRPSPRMRAIDKGLGDLAYPVFLVHWLAGFFVALAFFPDGAKGWGLTVAATPLTVAAAIGLAALNNRWIEPLRTSIRSRETPVLGPACVPRQAEATSA